MKNSNVYIIIIIGLVVLIFFRTIYYNTKINENNFLYNDSTLYWKNKANEYYHAKLIQVNLTDSLKKEYDNLKSSKTTPIYISKIYSEIRVDTVFSFHTDTVFLGVDSLYKIKSSIENKHLNVYTTISSRDSISTMNLDSLIIPVTVNHNIVKREHRYYSLVRSDNPYFRIKNQESMIELPREKKYTLNMGIGYGAGYYDNKVILTPFVGIMFGWRIF